jgi:hypothetical protein
MIKRMSGASPVQVGIAALVAVVAAAVVAWLSSRNNPDW